MPDGLVVWARDRWLTGYRHESSVSTPCLEPFLKQRFSERRKACYGSAMLLDDAAEFAEVLERDYTIRENPRSKHVRLRLTLEDGLEVVVPKAYNRRRIPEIVAAKRAWLRRSAERLLTEAAARPGELAQPPHVVELPAVSRTLEVLYRSSDSKRVAARVRPDGTVTVSGAVHRYDAVQAALRRAIMRLAFEELEPWVRELASRHPFTVERVGVRAQRRRWGSCSGRGVISLNAKLLFLPRELTRHVILHELCHTVHLNHGKAFWRLLALYDPSYREHDRALRTAGRFVPIWFE